jgi:hypothetical protein
MWMTAAAAVLATTLTGCADSGALLSSPTAPSVAGVTTPTVPSTCTVPSAPDDLSAAVTGAAVSLAWSPVDAALDYVLLIGRTPSASDILLTNTSESHHNLEQMEPGTLFARVHAHNWCGTSEASKPITFTVH